MNAVATITFQAIDRLKEIDEFAKLQPITFDLLKEFSRATPKSKVFKEHMKSIKRQTIREPDFSATITYEHQEFGYVRHLSVTSTKPGMFPPMVLIRTITSALWNTVPDNCIFAWEEKVDKDRVALNFIFQVPN